MLITDRLLLRRWRDSDRAPFAAMTADPLVMEFFPSTLSRGESDALVDRIEAGFERDGFGLWAVEQRVDGEFLGFVGLSRPSFEVVAGGGPLVDPVEIGWRLRREAWGRGLGTEAARAVLDHALDPAGADLPGVVSFTAALNLRSRALMERIGLRRDPADDFAHPALPPGHRLRPHVLYRTVASLRPGGRPVAS